MQSISVDNSAYGIRCQKINVTNLSCHYQLVNQILGHKFWQTPFLLFYSSFDVLFKFSLKLYSFVIVKKIAISKMITWIQLEFLKGLNWYDLHYAKA